MIRVKEVNEQGIVFQVEEGELLVEADEEMVKKAIEDQTELLKMVFQNINQKPIEVLNQIKELRSQLEKAYLIHKSKNGLEIKISEKPPTQEIVLTELIHVINNEYIVLKMDDGKHYILAPKTPREASELIKKSDMELLGFLDRLNLPTSNIIKEKYTISYPYLHAYLSEGRIIFSRTPLRQGTIIARLRVPRKDELEELFDSIPDRELYQLLAKISKALTLPLPSIPTIKTEEEHPGRKDLEAVIPILKQQVLEDTRLRIIEVGLTGEEYRQAIENWKTIIHELDNTIERIDPLIENFYKAMSLHYYKPHYMPNTILITSTNAGKTTLYKILVEKDPGPIGDTTSVSLVPHYNTITRVLEQGILHNRTKAVQIEKTETALAREEADIINEYMKSGETARSILGKTIKMRGTGPIIFTGNIKRGPNKILGLQATLMEQLMNNPEALSSRLLLFYKETEQLKIKDSKKLQELGEIIRGVIDHPDTLQKLRRIWEYTQVIEWLEKEDEPLEIEFTDTNGTGDLYSKIKQYITGLAKHYHKPLKALALNRALYDHLDEIILEENLEDKLPRIIEEAREHYDHLKQELYMGIHEALNEIITKDPHKIIRNLSLYTQRTILAAIEHVEKHPENQRTHGKTIVDIDIQVALEEHIQEKPELYGKIRPRHVKKHLKQNLPHLRRTLEDAGIHIYEDDQGNLYMSINMDTIQNINKQELEQEISRKMLVRK